MSRTVLLTGASGFIGSHVIPCLSDRGFEIHALAGRSVHQHSDGPCVWHHADVLDSASISGVLKRVRATHLLHLAWITTPGAYWTSPDNDSWVRASVALAESFLASGGQRFVVAGTCAEYDWSHGWCREGQTPLEPVSRYGAAKLRLSEQLAKLAEETDAELSWARIFFPFGPREHPGRLVSSVCRSLVAGDIGRCSLGFQVRDFVYVEDVAGALAALVDSDCGGPINIGSGRPVPVRELVLRLADRLTAQNRVHFGAIQSADEWVPLVAADVTRLRSKLGWRPRFTMDEALDRTVGWWQSQSQPLTHTVV